MIKIISGVQATNSLTLGNYIGAIIPLLELQKTNKLLIFIANLHSITIDFTPSRLKLMQFDVAKIYLASGINPQQSIIFNQSDVSAHSELSWILTCHTNIGQLNRMTQFKDKSQKKQVNGTTKIPTGLLIYPVLMAADILLYSPELVPVGADQKQHVELTRDIAINFNNKYNCNVFKIPEFLTSITGGKIMDLKDPSIKMSKSNKNVDGVIFMLEDVDVVRKKIMSAKTDLINKVKVDSILQPGITNLLNIYSSITNIPLIELEEKFESFSYKDFKTEVADQVCQKIELIQKKYHQLKDSDVAKILLDGSNTSKVIANKKLLEVKKIIGLNNE